VSVSFTGKGPLDAAVREDPGEVVSEIAARCRCHAELGSVTCAPEVDVELLRRGDTLMSEIIKVSEDLGGLSDEQIIDMLCTGPAADLREELELLAYKGELKPLLAEAELSLLSRIAGGSE